MNQFEIIHLSLNFDFYDFFFLLLNNSNYLDADLISHTLDRFFLVYLFSMDFMFLFYSFVYLYLDSWGQYDPARNKCNILLYFYSQILNC